MNAAVLAMLAAYKHNVAGTYRSCPPGEMLTTLPPGPCIVSEKIDGETWFLHADGERALRRGNARSLRLRIRRLPGGRLHAVWGRRLHVELRGPASGKKQNPDQRDGEWDGEQVQPELHSERLLRACLEIAM